MSDINYTSFSSEKNKVSDPGVIFSVNYITKYESYNS